MAQQFKVGPARMVYGHPLKPREKTDMRTKQPVLRDGQKIMQRTFGLAIPKGQAFDAVYAVMYAEAMSVFPQGVPPRFAWKIKDGDGTDSKGQPYSKREGYAGHWILSYSTELDIQCVRFDPNTRQYVQMQAHEIKTGDYFVVPTTFQANQPKNATDTPGLYVNPQIIEFVGYGTEIISGPDAMDLLGGQTYQLPAGASATPLAPNSGGMGYPGQPGAPSIPGQPGAPAIPPQPGQPAPQAPAYAPPPPAAPGVGGYPAQAPGGAPGAYPSSPPAPGGYGAMPGQPAGGAAPQPGYPAPATPPANGAYPSNSPVHHGQMPPPAPDFVSNASGQPAPGYPQPGATQAPQPGYPQPGAAPGFMPPGGMQ